MKKLFFVLITCALWFSPVKAQEPANVATDSTTEVVQDSIKQEIPDTVCVTIESVRYCVPTTDVKSLVTLVKTVEQENKGNWPGTIIGWISLVLLWVSSGKITQAFVSGKNIYNFLKPKLKDTLFMVVLVAGGVGTGITFLFGMGKFDYSMFLTVWPWTALAAIFIYEKWIKKPDPETAKK